MTQGDELGAADGFYGTAVAARRAAGAKALAVRVMSLFGSHHFAACW